LITHFVTVIAYRLAGTGWLAASTFCIMYVSHALPLFTTLPMMESQARLRLGLWHQLLGTHQGRVFSVQRWCKAGTKGGI